MASHISILSNDQGESLETHEEIQQELLDHFKASLMEPPLDFQAAIESITKHIPALIMDEHNQMLLRPVILREVDQAMAQLKVGKATGPDGFTTNLFHFFWQDLRKKVWEMVEESRSMHWMLPALNATFITLIPKEY